jgi:hypothetical protein
MGRLGKIFRVLCFALPLLTVSNDRPSAMDDHGTHGFAVDGIRGKDKGACIFSKCFDKCTYLMGGGFQTFRQCSRHCSNRGCT